MPAPFISRQDLSDRLGRDVTNDAGALSAVDAACDLVRDEAGGQEFNLSTSTVTLDGTGTNALAVPQLPLITAGTVVVNSQTMTLGTDYVVDTERGFLFRKSSSSDWWWEDALPPTTWPIGTQNVVVTYEHGYADADLPRSVREIALQLAMRMVVQGVAKSQSIGPASVTYDIGAGEFTETERRTLRGYARG